MHLIEHCLAILRRRCDGVRCVRATESYARFDQRPPSVARLHVAMRNDGGSFILLKAAAWGKPDMRTCYHYPSRLSTGQASFHLTNLSVVCTLDTARGSMAISLCHTRVMPP